MSDPRLSDEATGLPPLDELNDDPSVLALLWATGEGLGGTPANPHPVIYLHVRGLSTNPDDPTGVDWVQAHIAFPRDAVADVISVLTHALE